uniref:Uncharacterized protein n=1 Tax=Chromera velia CCMP2878 TaxID=1169474 RepID=A0A0G4GDS3_9ALVE|eukprot:Cvel_21414.t1-p1 / transcript=Cvel_21414.t1 / gene=Cvel_21414 / organism=Chromera_velia_CCMP2878 / gene_product=hypothetical protein / transcript_product=hypothetical protein / location=Cvel_scaffold2006:11933-26781(+) / protein_length=810 / sequence_SO=supercontig / SO=protein_coding / is_pseudo=false
MGVSDPPEKCDGCGEEWSIRHVEQYTTRGLVHMRHNELAEEVGELLEEREPNSAFFARDRDPSEGVLSLFHTSSSALVCPSMGESDLRTGGHLVDIRVAPRLCSPERKTMHDPVGEREQGGERGNRSRGRTRGEGEDEHVTADSSASASSAMFIPVYRPPPSMPICGGPHEDAEVVEKRRGWEREQLGQTRGHSRGQVVSRRGSSASTSGFPYEGEKGDGPTPIVAALPPSPRAPHSVSPSEENVELRRETAGQNRLVAVVPPLRLSAGHEKGRARNAPEEHAHLEKEKQKGKKGEGGRYGLTGGQEESLGEDAQRESDDGESHEGQTAFVHEHMQVPAEFHRLRAEAERNSGEMRRLRVEVLQLRRELQRKEARRGAELERLRAEMQVEVKKEVEKAKKLWEKETAAAAGTKERDARSDSAVSAATLAAKEESMKVAVALKQQLQRSEEQFLRVSSLLAAAEEWVRAGKGDANSNTSKGGTSTKALSPPEASNAKSNDLRSEAISVHNANGSPAKPLLTLSNNSKSASVRPPLPPSHHPLQRTQSRPPPSGALSAHSPLPAGAQARPPGPASVLHVEASASEPEAPEAGSRPVVLRHTRIQDPAQLQHTGGTEGHAEAKAALFKPPSRMPSPTGGEALRGPPTFGVASEVLVTSAPPMNRKPRDASAVQSSLTGSLNLSSHNSKAAAAGFFGKERAPSFDDMTTLSSHQKSVREHTDGSTRPSPFSTDHPRSSLAVLQNTRLQLGQMTSSADALLQKLQRESSISRRIPPQPSPQEDGSTLVPRTQALSQKCEFAEAEWLSRQPTTSSQ